MHQSKIVLLINESCRAITVEYEPHGTTEVAKTFDSTIKAGDFVVVESKTRWDMTTAKVRKVDVDVDFDANDNVRWVLQKVDMEAFSALLEQEEAAISAVNSAERRKKREALKASMFADHAAEFEALQIAGTPDLAADITE